MTNIRLGSLRIERIWPMLTPIQLAYLELKQDPYFSYLPPNEITTYLQKTIDYGKKVATDLPAHTNLSDLLNHILKKGLRICYRKIHPTDSQIRAQYIHRPATIEIYENSIKQIQHFISEQITRIREDELICLHLYHEYFHHLEETEIERADLKLPKCTLKKWGPFTIKKSFSSLREIAAHAFAQTMMGLHWSPLLLDRLIYYTKQGWTKTQIREYFARVKQELAELSEASLAAAEG